MKAIFRWRLLLVAGACLVASAGSAWAQTTGSAGRFLSVTGDVSVVAADGARRKAERGGEFRQGDTIVTGPNALAQARTADGGLLSIRADTEMKLDKFAYAGEKDSNASFLVSLLKGGFRTITGLIGRANRDGYRVTTPSATIGIRGTHYELVHVLPQASSPQALAGTYNRVYDGMTTLQNKAGVQVVVSRDQTAFVSLPGNIAPVLVTPPTQIFGKPTPVPRLTPQSSTGGRQTSSGGDDKAQARGAAPASGAAASQSTLVKPTEGTTTIRSGTVLQVSPTMTLTPIDSTSTVRSPTTTLQVAPTTTFTPIDSTSTVRSPTTTLQTAPTVTIQPAPTTLQVVPTTTLQLAPITTIQPAPTTLQTAPVMIAPVMTAPTTTTIQPSPTTTLSPTTTTIKLAPTTTITK